VIDVAVEDISSAELLALEALYEIEKNGGSISKIEKFSSNTTLNVASTNAVSYTQTLTSAAQASFSSQPAALSPWSHLVDAVRPGQISLDTVVNSYRGIALSVSHRQNEVLRITEKVVKCYAPGIGYVLSLFIYAFIFLIDNTHIFM
jgi:hypothetical protein